MAKHLFQKGNPGRPKGAKSKFRISTVKEFFREKEIDPIAEMYGLYKQLTNPVDKLAFWIKVYPWIETRVNKIENIETRTEELTTALENRADVKILEILQPEKNAANG